MRLALAINNQRLMQSIYYGTAETAASILPRASWVYDNEAKITEYNPAKSREQLKALGLENLTLQLWVPTSSQAWNPSPLKTAELIQADMAQVGVKVKIIPGLTLSGTKTHVKGILVVRLSKKDLHLDPFKLK